MVKRERLLIPLRIPHAKDADSFNTESERVLKVDDAYVQPFWC